MKNIWMLSLLMGLGMTTLLGQNSDRNQMRERIESQRVAFITSEVGLTQEEAQQFWPIYNEYRAEETRDLMDLIPEKKLNDLSESEAHNMINQVLEAEKKRAERRSQLVSDLQGVLPPVKVLKLMVAERKFRERLLKAIQERRRQRN